MKYLKSQRAFQRWSVGINRGQPQAPIATPVEYPCFGYLTVLSYGYEEDQAEYLYDSDIRSMAERMSQTLRTTPAGAAAQPDTTR